MSMSIKIETEISDEQIRGLLCTAFEGGANYWYTDLTYDLPKGISFEEFREGGARQPKGHYWHWCQLIPLVEGCALVLRDKIDDDFDEEDESTAVHRITREDIEKGMKLFAKKYPSHFSDFLNENDDAITGDVFLQCVVFGEVLYG